VHMKHHDDHMWGLKTRLKFSIFQDYENVNDVGGLIVLIDEVKSLVSFFGGLQSKLFTFYNGFQKFDWFQNLI
jgi:hypothetical protein